MQEEAFQDRAKSGERPAFGMGGLLDALMFIAILGFSAVALLALALAAPLAIAVSAFAGAVSAVFARERVRGGWRIVSVL